MICDETRSHEAHGWWYERVVLDWAASIKCEEPIGQELCTWEWCTGVEESE